MDNGLLYAYSTIAQALGGAFALLAAFVLFRLQSLAPVMWEDSNRFRNEFVRAAMTVLAMVDFQWYDTLRVQGKYVELLARIAPVVNKAGIQNVFPGEGDFYLRFQENIRLEEKIIRAFLTATLFTGATMFGSVAVIPFVHRFSSCESLAMTVAILGVVAFGLTLWRYWKVMAVTLFGDGAR